LSNSAHLEFAEAFAGQEAATLGLEFDDAVRDFLVPLVFQLRQDTRPEENLRIKPNQNSNYE
jgi:hypothetical protein